MKNDKLIPLMLNGDFDTIENVLTYTRFKELSEVEIHLLIWEDMRKMIGEKIEILPDTDTLTKEPIIRVFGLELTESEEQSFWDSCNCNDLDV